MNGDLSLWANKTRLGLIGNPENRRITEFQRAAHQQGLPMPACLSYEEILSKPESLDFFEADLIRVDSPGENPRVAQKLVALGGGPINPELEFGEIRYVREYHDGFCAVLERIEARGVRCINSPRDIAVMFDKWKCHERFIEHGIARPESRLAPTNAAVFFEEIRSHRNGRLFLKPLHGSSASGVCALRWTSSRMQLIAPLRITQRNGRRILVNSLEVQSYSDASEIALILESLLPQRMIIEEWIPKLTLPGGAIDLRVLVIAGEARHWVVRQSRSPMTNLHLGNRRGDCEELLQVVGEEKTEEIFRIAKAAACCFPDSLYAGVDVLLDHSHRVFVGEINAFGDLLPGLVHRGETAYSAIAKACYDQCCPV